MTTYTWCWQADRVINIHDDKGNIVADLNDTHAEPFRSKQQMEVQAIIMTAALNGFETIVPADEAAQIMAEWASRQQKRIVEQS